MKKLKTITKGFFVNFIYESYYLAYKILILCVALLIVQSYFMISSFEILKNSHNAYYDWSIKYVDLSQVFEESPMPFFFVAFLVLALVLCYYIIKKDGEKRNVIKTLPYPKVCNFFVKYFYCVLSVGAVYIIQYFMMLFFVNYINETSYIKFRDNEIFQSSVSSDLFGMFFPVNTKIIVVISLILMCVSLVFWIANLNFNEFSKSKSLFIIIPAIICLIVSSFNLGGNAMLTHIYASVVMMIISVTFMYESYKNY